MSSPDASVWINHHEKNAVVYAIASVVYDVPLPHHQLPGC
jgi:hypothetical protein